MGATLLSAEVANANRMALVLRTAFALCPALGCPTLFVIDGSVLRRRAKYSIPRMRILRLVPIGAFHTSS
jgi:hypothetical protein